MDLFKFFMYAPGVFMMEAKPEWEAQFEELERCLTPDSTDFFLDLWSRQFGPEFVKALRGNLPKNLVLSVVADASSLLSILYRFLKGRASPVWDFVQAGILQCWAPIEQLNRDLDGKFEYLGKKVGLPADRVKEEWDNRIAPHVRVDEVNAPPEVFVRLDALRRRDPSDVDYVGLAFTIAADGVFTTDKDIIQDGGVRIVSFNEAIRIATVYKRGRLATTVQLRCKVAGLVMGTLLFGLLFEGGKVVVAFIRRVPWQVWTGIGVALLGLLLIPDTRAWMARQATWLREKLRTPWNNTRECVLELMRVWGPVFAAASNARSEAEKFLESNPHFAKRKPYRRVSLPPEFEEAVVKCVKASEKPIRPGEILKRLCPNVAACDVSRIRRRISQMLSRRSDVRRLGNGVYIPTVMVGSAVS